MTAKVQVQPGQMFSSWKLLEEVANPRPGQYWRARCVCGAIKIVRLRYLTNGHSKSCGCQKSPKHAESSALRSRQLRTIREQYGKQCSNCRENKSLDDFYPDKRRGDGRGIWCKVCHNANLKTIALKKGFGNRPRGGHNRRVVNAGDKFYDLTVIREVDSPPKLRMFECRCECGTTKIVRLNNMVTGQVKSCGCRARNKNVADALAAGRAAVAAKKQKTAPWAR